MPLTVSALLILGVVCVIVVLVRLPRPTVMMDADYLPQVRHDKCNFACMHAEDLGFNGREYTCAETCRYRDNKHD